MNQFQFHVENRLATQGDGVTKRHSRVLAGLVADMSHKEIAEGAGLAAETVRTYSRDLMSAMGVHSRHQICDGARLFDYLLPPRPI